MKFNKKICIITAFCLIMTLLIWTGNAVSAGTDSSLVAHYTFDDNLTDSSGNGNDGTAVGNITFAQGPVGKAALFDGKSYIEVKDSDSLDLGKEFTISVWLFGNENEKWQGILQKQGSEYSESVAAYTVEMNGMKPGFQMSDAGGKVDRGNQDSNKQVDCHKWYLLTITYDGSDLKFYCNGDMLAKQELYGGTCLDKSIGKLLIGYAHIFDGEFYYGRMDDLRIYNRLLSQVEIKQLYNDAAAGPGIDLVVLPPRMIAYYNFNNDIKDYSGYGNDGQIASGNIKYVDSIASKGAYFDGSSYIEVKDSDMLELDKSFTITAWLKLDQLTKEQWAQPIISRTRSSINLNMDSYDFYINSSYSPLYMASFNFNNFTTGGWNTSDAREVMGPGGWTMVTVTFDGTDMKFYKNLKLVSSVKPDGANSGDLISHSMGKLWIGHLIDRGDEYFTRGIIDELRIFNSALDDNLILSQYVSRDLLNLITSPSISLDSMKVKQSVQITPILLTFVYTPNPEFPGYGKSDWKPSDVSGKVTYKSDKPKVVAVSDTGKLTAISKGSAKLTATYGNVIREINVVVK